VIQFKIKEQDVILAKFGAPEVFNQVIVAVRTANPTKVVMVDCGTKPASIAIAAIIKRMGIPLIIRDHCDINGEPRIEEDKLKRLSADALRGLGSAGTRISNHDLHRYCAYMIEACEFRDPGTMLIADLDADGFMGAMKGIGFRWAENQLRTLSARLDVMKRRIPKEDWAERERASEQLFMDMIVELERSYE